MSTCYYPFREPFTGAHVSRDGETVVIRLTSREGDGEFRGSPDMEALILLGLADRDDQIAYRSNGLASMEHNLPDSQQLISEYGDLTTIGELRRGVAP